MTATRSASDPRLQESPPPEEGADVLQEPVELKEEDFFEKKQKKNGMV